MAAEGAVHDPVPAAQQNSQCSALTAAVVCKHTHTHTVMCNLLYFMNVNVVNVELPTSDTRLWWSIKTRVVVQSVWHQGMCPGNDVDSDTSGWAEETCEKLRNQTVRRHYSYRLSLWESCWSWRLLYVLRCTVTVSVHNNIRRYRTETANYSRMLVFSISCGLFTTWLSIKKRLRSQEEPRGTPSTHLNESNTHVKNPSPPFIFLFTLI